MKTLTHAETCDVAGGLIGGGYTRSGIPLCDASATREPGQNSYGELIPGGLVFYEEAMTMAGLQMQGDRLLAAQAASCTTGNLLVCAIDTAAVLNNQLEQAGRRRP